MRCAAGVASAQRGAKSHACPGREGEGMDALLLCGIIYWLFGGAIRNLGGPAHVTQWLQPLQEQKYTGMFAMTERGHGSNVRGIQTEATFDFSAQEFVIDTPCENAEKMYIGNAMYGNYAAVFAQLIINGRSQGPHCFIVPVRDENGSLYPGVTVVDMMHKEGLHGVDNGILRFDNVRIPRENLLDKFGSVAPDGQYHSPIKDKSARFNAMLAALTPSRLAVTFQAMGSMKLGLTIAIRYSHSRRQFGPKAREEVKIIEHQTQTLRLMPHLATALALTFAGRYASTLLDEDIFRGKELVSSRTLQALVAGLKAYSTWENVSCLQDCRECTGGMGYMMENQISGLKCDTDVFVTFEGDNVVMLQVVVRELLAQYTKQCEERPVSSVLRNWVESGSDRLRTSFLAFNMDTVGNLTFLLKAVHFRERTLQRGLVARIYYKVMTEKEDFFSAWNSCLHHITCLSLAHIHRVTLEQFCLAVRNCPDQEDQALLKKMSRFTENLPPWPQQSHTGGKTNDATGAVLRLLRGIPLGLLSRVSRSPAPELMQQLDPPPVSARLSRPVPSVWLAEGAASGLGNGSLPFEGPSLCLCAVEEASTPAALTTAAPASGRGFAGDRPRLTGGWQRQLEPVKWARWQLV
ncbi:PREDICTED: acyl-coenzyme A oxidase-like protein [Capra hircus]|uniref:acyl-coenzyme A oxidase-like protein n=1 Tax=Capra hircus TaxID=9925 RepID=UPI0008468A20|nr:PREDICTED: acyl-coenzyme A oxidase-like protein [Capra hircus]